jgi:hypothetical protein
MIGLMCFGNFGYTKPLTLDEVLEGSCRISSNQVVRGKEIESFGSGTCIAPTNDKYIFLTNGHVVKNSVSVYIELFKRGKKSYKIPATVMQVWLEDQTDKDFALLSIDKKHVAQYPPRIIPLAPLAYSISTGYIFSAGCPEGGWLQAWEGTVEQKFKTYLVFSPPPVGGQSGSSLLVNISDKKGELHTRVGSVIAYRLVDAQNDRKDKNGFENAKGVALPVSTLYHFLNNEPFAPQPIRLPVNYIPVSTEKCKECKRPLIDHALGSDNRHYCVTLKDNGVMSCDAFDNVQILRWPDRNRLVPLPLPMPTVPPINGNPYKDLPDILPPDINIVPPVVKPDSDVETLLKKINDLEQTIEQLMQDKNKLSNDLNKTLEDAKKALEEAKNKKTTTEEEVAILKQELVEKTKKLEMTDDKKGALILSLEQEIKEKTNQINTTSTNLTNIQNEKTELGITITQAVETTEKLKEQRTWLGWLGGLLSAGLISSLIWIYWTRRGKKKTHQVVDSLQDMIDERLKRVMDVESIDNIRSVVDELQEAAELAVDEAIKTHVPAMLNQLIEKKTAESGPVVQIDNFEKTQDSSDNKTYNKRRRNRTGGKKRDRMHNTDVISDPVSVNITNTNINSPEDTPPAKKCNKNIPTDETSTEDTSTEEVPTPTPINAKPLKLNDSYFKEFFANKEKDGESVETWALRGSIYREAIAELKKGKLYYKGYTKLLGQQQTAKQINIWVRTEFLKRKDEMINQDQLYIEAMFGFLYKEAIALLAAGEFSVLGHDNTAIAIQSWVDNALLQRMNVTI